MAAILKRTFVLTVLAVLSAPFPAAAKGGSTTAAPFLRLGAGARGAALGEAFSAIVDDATALYWNPAALGLAQGRSVTFMHATHIDESFYDFAAYGQQLKTGGFGLGVQYFSAGSIDKLDLIGNQEGSFTPNDLAVMAGYAHKWGNYRLGVVGKFVQTKLVDRASTFTGDAGFLTPLYGGRVRFAAAVSNMGGSIQYDRESARMPLVVRAGSALAITPRWNLGLDAVVPRDEEAYLGIGTEYNLPLGKDLALAFRGGHSGAGGGNGLRGGVGFGFHGLAIDYSFAALDDFGGSHRISLGYRWDANPAVRP